MPSLADGMFDYVQTNAVMEHVLDLPQVVAELARVTRTGGIHAHQVDFRDHRNFDRPLDHLLLDPIDYNKQRIESKASCGTAQRMPEMIEHFSKHFWLWKIENQLLAEPAYVAEICSKLPKNSAYKSWPPQLLRVIGGRLWFVRKPGGERNRWFRK